MGIYKITNVAKYRSFQYKLLQRGLVTDIQLAKWGIAQSELCNFCSEKTETVAHILFECSEVQSLWYQLQKYLEEKISRPTSPTHCWAGFIGYNFSS